MKFKFTWGHAMALALIAFMAFILSLIFIADNTGELVDENYYEDAVVFQENNIDAQKRANALSIKPEIMPQANGLNIKFPDSLQIDSGNVYLIRLADKNLDVKAHLKLYHQSFLIHSSKLKEGEYDLKLHWYAAGKNYLIQKTITWKQP